MADRWVEERNFLDVGRGESLRVYVTIQGALYACFQLAVALQSKLIDLEPRDPARHSINRTACVWRRSNHQEWVVGEPGVKLPGDWWNCLKLEAPLYPLELHEALVESGQVAMEEYRPTIGQDLYGEPAT